MKSKNFKTGKPQVVGFGALNMDLLHQVDYLAGADEETFIKNVTTSCGGSAANTIIGLSKLGLKTGYIGKVARDDPGKILKSNLIKENVDTSHLLLSSHGRSGRVMGFIDLKGQRALYVDPGVNDDILIRDIDLEYVNQSQVLHLTSFVGDSFKTQLKLVGELEDDLILSFDPGRIYVEKGLKKLKKIIERTDILLINEIELQVLTGSSSYQESAVELQKEGLEIVVVKRGAEGVYATNGEDEVDLPPFQVECRDSTGAGDAFNTGFLYAHLNHFSLKESCRSGNLIASRCIQSEGATSGLPDNSIFENF
ncbi:carbohydrate kinase family protein [Methanobacterium alkalithermotolerans]|uniref:Carbohydrate kinase family protein n=1 Tax=Methanobacterium alkalithermotolerans TaxID=2731220 RepID=A0A8T8K224_9EURY|nr:carbohydrate kinase family protein [Methanobacterium alkalithermotolerans]QUH22536.1 carbohydrate kinase family protein [Methanobacterium alkalithermotolerans]